MYPSRMVALQLFNSLSCNGRRKGNARIRNVQRLDVEHYFAGSANRLQPQLDLDISCKRQADVGRIETYIVAIDV